MSEKDEKVKEILEREIDEPGSLDRLEDYAKNVFDVIVSCGECNCQDNDACGNCPGYRPALELEYAMQTQIILFAEEIRKGWLQSDGGK